MEVNTGRVDLKREKKIQRRMTTKIIIGWKLSLFNITVVRSNKFKYVILHSALFFTAASLDRNLFSFGFLRGSPTINRYNGIERKSKIKKSKRISCCSIFFPE